MRSIRLLFRSGFTIACLKSNNILFVSCEVLISVSTKLSVHYVVKQLFSFADTVNVYSCFQMNQMDVLLPRVSMGFALMVSAATHASVTRDSVV